MLKRRAAEQAKDSVGLNGMDAPGGADGSAGIRGGGGSGGMVGSGTEESNPHGSSSSFVAAAAAQNPPGFAATTHHLDDVACSSSSSSTPPDGQQRQRQEQQRQRQRQPTALPQRIVEAAGHGMPGGTPMTGSHAFPTPSPTGDLSVDGVNGGGGDGGGRPREEGMDEGNVTPAASLTPVESPDDPGASPAAWPMPPGFEGPVTCDSKSAAGLVPVRTPSPPSPAEISDAALVGGTGSGAGGIFVGDRYSNAGKGGVTAAEAGADSVTGAAGAAGRSVFVGARGVVAMDTSIQGEEQTLPTAAVSPSELHKMAREKEEDGVHSGVDGGRHRVPKGAVAAAASSAVATVISDSDEKLRRGGGSRGVRGGDEPGAAIMSSPPKVRMDALAFAWVAWRGVAWWGVAWRGAALSMGLSSGDELYALEPPSGHLCRVLIQ